MSKSTFRAISNGNFLLLHFSSVSETKIAFLIVSALIISTMNQSSLLTLSLVLVVTVSGALAAPANGDSKKHHLYAPELSFHMNIFISVCNRLNQRTVRLSAAAGVRRAAVARPSNGAQGCSLSINATPIWTTKRSGCSFNRKGKAIDSTWVATSVSWF